MVITVNKTHAGTLKTRLRKCSFFEWKDEEQADGYYKNLLYSLKQKLDAKDEMYEMNNLRRMIVEVEFLLSQEQYKVAKSEKEVHDAMKSIGRLESQFHKGILYVLKLDQPPQPPHLEQLAQPQQLPQPHQLPHP
uniref:Uncharacterized protein n=1 Tax=Lactuca sativa TaxID=4236 RepID=A0A9R1WW56_LACSA|nr:hypothetical protein LSAT_V11C900485930 [Lactuca sativa]